MRKISDFVLTQKNKNRNSLEIVRDILFAASEKTKKTRIMYQASLSYRLLKKYLKSLLESGLVECVDDSFYLITWKGKEFLQSYHDYLHRCRKIGEEIKEAENDKLLLKNLCFNNKNNSKPTPTRKEVIG